jgi:hypothetical protein
MKEQDSERNNPTIDLPFSPTLDKKILLNFGKFQVVNKGNICTPHFQRAISCHIDCRSV